VRALGSVLVMDANKGKGGGKSCTKSAGSKREAGSSGAVLKYDDGSEWEGQRDHSNNS
jgi:hypothetical protein